MSPEERAREAGFSPAEIIRLLSGDATKDKNLYARYRRTKWWNIAQVKAEKAWRLALDVPMAFALECICGCGRPHDQWHHTNDGYYHLFAERPSHLRPMAARCHRKLHAGRQGARR